MSAGSRTCSHETCEDSGNATSSPASAGGASRSDSQDGRTTSRCGPDRAHASPSAPPENNEDSRMSGTCGPSSSASSRSAALSLSLASRLRLRLGRSTESAGSTLYTMTWSERATPSGRPYSQLRASVRSISETGCTLWPTPVASDANPFGKLVSAARQVAFGQMQSGLHHGPVGKSVQLNPEFVLWLMGYPVGWAWCMARATRSSLSKRLLSSRPMSKRADEVRKVAGNRDCPESGQ